MLFSRPLFFVFRKSLINKRACFWVNRVSEDCFSHQTMDPRDLPHEPCLCRAHEHTELHRENAASLISTYRSSTSHRALEPIAYLSVFLALSRSLCLPPSLPHHPLHLPTLSTPPTSPTLPPHRTHPAYPALHHTLRARLLLKAHAAPRPSPQPMTVPAPWHPRMPASSPGLPAELSL